MLKILSNFKNFMFFLVFLSFFVFGIDIGVMANMIDVKPNFSPIYYKSLKNIGPKPLPEISLRARKAGIQPAFFKNVTIKLKQTVIWLTDEQIEIIKNNENNGRIAESVVSFVEPGLIYVDPHTLLAMKFIKDGSGYYTIIESDDDVVEDISIPEQKIFLNEANITQVVPGVNVVSQKGRSSTIEGVGFTFYFDEQQKLPGFDKEGKLVEVGLKGYLTLDAPSVEVKYSKHKGYKILFMASENAKVEARLHADLKKDVKVPLYEYSIPVEGCKVSIGFYLYLKVDGSVTLAYTVTQTASVKAGIKGDTSYFIPTSIKTIKEVKFNLKNDNFSMSANIKGEASLLAEVLFEVLNKGKIVIDNKVGLLVEAKTSVQGGAGDYLSIKGDGFFKISGKIKVSSFDKSKDIYEYKYPLFSYVKERSSNYNITINEACAFKNIISGNILEIMSPYSNKDIRIKITSNNGTEKVINAKTDGNGNFNLSYDLKMGDYVSVNIPNTDRWSQQKGTTFPYDNVFIEYADYLTNTIKGYVSSSEQIPKYSDYVYVVVERTDNIPLHLNENISIPVTYNIKLPVKVVNGEFQTQNFNLRPFDKVYAVLESEGFIFSSNKLEADGINYAISGGYIQEENRLSSQNTVAIFSYTGATAPSIYNPILTIQVDYPHGKKKGEDKQSKEFKLRLKPVQGLKQYTAETGSWELELGNYMEQLTSSFEKFKGTYSSSGGVRYHVIESLVFFSEGKRFEYSNEALRCDEERKKSILGYVDKSEILGKGSNVKQQQIDIREPFVNVAPMSPNNFSADLTINYYSSPMSNTPDYSRYMKISILKDRQKVDMGIREPMIVWDKSNKTKVIVNREFKSEEEVRYDLDDYIPELKDVKYVSKGTMLVNGVVCNVWEKVFKINQFANIKLELYIAQGSNLPVKAIFYEGNLQKVELIFRNWKTVSEKI